MEKRTAIFFATPKEFRVWLSANHCTERELWVGFHKRHSKRPSMTWPESVDEALCFGWIDGHVKGVDDTRFMLRFTPRKARSIWSVVNIRNAEKLIREKRMQPAGLKAYAARKEYRSGIYSYEQRSPELVEPYATTLKSNKAAWKFFSAQPPGYRKMMNWYIVSAKQEQTRLARLEKLINASAKRQRMR